jgi:predicted O-linked N-acetylglucosamine transferase (SPINDLY family)
MSRLAQRVRKKAKGAAVQATDHRSDQRLMRAKALRISGNLSDSEKLAREVLRDEPKNASAWLSLAKTLAARKEVGAAEKAFEKVVALADDPFDAHIHLSLLLFQRGALNEAIEHTRRALALKPNDALSLSNYGGMLRKNGALTEAVQVLSRALAIAPDDANIHTNLGHALSALGRHEESVVHLARAVEIAPTKPLYHHNLLMMMHYASASSPEQIVAAHRRYGASVCGEGAVIDPPVPRDLNPQKRLRIGYVSSDFRRHSVSYFLEPLLVHRDRSAFWVAVYSSTHTPDEVTVRLREQCDLFRDVAGVDESALAKQIREDSIDILIDLSGHTAGNRLGVFVQKPAPIQITYLGYPDTTGLPTMDYRLTDGWADPEGMTEAFHTEKLLRMQGGFLCYHPPLPSPELTAPPCLAGSPPTFGSFNALAKMSDTTLKLWARILTEMPDARLRIKHIYLGHADSRKNFEGLLQINGIALDRVDLIGPVADHHGHLTAYRHVDVALDTYPYHGTTTTCDALWMGVPVVSLAGRTHVSRVGVSLLTRTGLADWVAHSEDEYVAIACALIRDTARLADFRKNARSRLQQGGVTDGPRVAKAFENALRSAYHDYLKTSPAALSNGPTTPTDEPIATELTEREAPLRLPGGIQLIVPAGHEDRTRYVLEEQADWYEGEIQVFRALLSGGETVIDVGAGSGIYALTAAQLVGPSGRVLAIESSRPLAERIRASARANRFDQLSVTEAAIPVAAITLDEVARRERLEKVNLIRFDLDDHTLNAIEGASELIARYSPVLMVRHREKSAQSEEVTLKLGELGYELYRMITGLAVLYPHPPGTETDPYLRYRFAARPESGLALQQKGLAARLISDKPAVTPPGSWQEVLRNTALLGRVDFKNPFAGGSPGQVRHRAALEDYAVAMRKELDISTRAVYLRAALQSALTSIEDPNDLSRLMSLARLAWAWGRRAIAVETLETAFAVASAGKARIDEPFLNPCPRYDKVDPGIRASVWALSGILEQLERLDGFSSYGATDPAKRLKRLHALSKLGFQSPEMARRLILVNRQSPILSAIPVNK